MLSVRLTETNNTIVAATIMCEHVKLTFLFFMLQENSFKSTSSDDDTKLLLKDAENCVSIMESKVDKSAFTAIQYNRTFKYVTSFFKIDKRHLIKCFSFSLRRDRFSKPLQDANKKNLNTKTANDKSNVYKPSNQNLSSSLSRVDCGRFSLRTPRAPQPNSVCKICVLKLK